MCRLALTLSASLLNNSRVTCEIERTLRRGANTPHAKYYKGKVEEHKLEIQELLTTLNLNAPSSNVDKRDPHFATAYPHTATTSAPERGKSLAPPSQISYGVLIAPQLFPRSKLQCFSL